jgi:alanine dehydrogenase
MKNKRITIGFPRMQKEAGEKRAFLPKFIQHLTHFADVYLAEGYGGKLGFSFDDYRQGNPAVFQVSRDDAFTKDYVIMLRSPREETYKKIPKGSCLISMLHYPTRPSRVKILNELGIHSISLDSVVDDHNQRMVENMRAVAWNGLEAAFDVLEKTWPELLWKEDKPFNVLILGTGMVGKHAIEAATKLGEVERYLRHMELDGPGAVATSIGRWITQNPAQMEKLMRQADILVDATQRHDTSTPVVPNEWIKWLPEHAVVVDLAVDPYLIDHEPRVVRGVEGIPQGNLNKYIFEPQDVEWEETVPESIPSGNRRTTVTCYSWPGIHPEACMELYDRQFTPFMEALLKVGYKGLTINGDYFERALFRAMLPPAEI